MDRSCGSSSVTWQSIHPHQWLTYLVPNIAHIVSTCSLGATCKTASGFLGIFMNVWPDTDFTMKPIILHKLQPKTRILWDLHSRVNWAYAYCNRSSTVSPTRAVNSVRTLAHMACINNMLYATCNNSNVWLLGLATLHRFEIAPQVP